MIDLRKRLRRTFDYLASHQPEKAIVGLQSALCGKLSILCAFQSACYIFRNIFPKFFTQLHLPYNGCPGKALLTVLLKISTAVSLYSYSFYIMPSFLPFM